MTATTRRRIQIFLLAVLVVTAARTLSILYQRRESASSPAPTPAAPRAVNPDFYVYPPRAYLTGFASAQKRKGSAVWVRDGYRYAHFPYDAAARRTRAVKDPPLLPPIERITIRDVVKEPGPRPGQDRVSVVFEQPGASPPLRSVQVGVCDRRGEDCTFFLDQIFFLKDPHELYSHWKPEAWDAIARHEAKPGMTETQISFALGYGRYLGQEDSRRVVAFGPVVVTFGMDGYAKSVRQGDTDAHGKK